MNFIPVTVLEISEEVESEIQFLTFNNIRLICFGYGYGLTCNDKIKKGVHCSIAISSQIFNEVCLTVNSSEKRKLSFFTSPLISSVTLNFSDEKLTESVIKVGEGFSYRVTGVFAGGVITAKGIMFDLSEYGIDGVFENMMLSCIIDRLDLEEIHLTCQP
mgnify:CR=1 FL=1